MTSRTPIIRPLARADLDAFYGSERTFPTVRGYALARADEVLAIGGLMYTSPLQAFSEIRGDARRYPKLLMRLAFRVCRIYDDCDSTVLARVSGNHPNAENFLRHLGFVPYNRETFAWPNQPQ